MYTKMIKIETTWTTKKLYSVHAQNVILQIILQNGQYIQDTHEKRFNGATNSTNKMAVSKRQTR